MSRYRCAAPRRLQCLLVALVVLVGLSGIGPAGASPADATPPSAPDATPPSAADTVRLVVEAAAGARRDVLAAARREAPGATVQPVASPDALGAHVVEVPRHAAERIATRLAAEPAVDHVEAEIPAALLGSPAAERSAAPRPAGAATSSSETDPNDPLYGDQWGLATAGLPGAWATSAGGDEVVIAVLDTGVDADHEDLADVVLEGRNVTDSGDSHDTSDAHGHGTHVAGVAAAATDNDLGVAGACRSCAILPVKVLGDDGSGWDWHVAEGIRWAADAGADVINLSLGLARRSRWVADAVADAHAQGAVVVAAAGNAGTSDEVYPAAEEDAIGVAASTGDDDRASFSSHGDWVDLAAPGTDIHGPVPQPNRLGCAGDYCQLQGTSTAAPLVAGVAGLARSLEEPPDNEAVRVGLADGAVHVGDWVAHGRVDAAAALAGLAGADSGGSDETPDEDGADDEGGDGDDVGDGHGDSEDDADKGDSGDHDADPGLIEAPAGVVRVAGAQRFATAAQLSQATFPAGGASTAYVATGTGFADALAAGAAAGAQRGPVLLATRDALPDATRDELRRLAPDEVIVVGGTGAISDAVARAAGDAARARVTRQAGSDRFATAAGVATHAFDPGVDAVYVATGTGFADALAGVPAAVVDRAPVLLTAGDALPRPTREAIGALAPGRVVVLGGTGAVSRRVEAELAGLAGAGGVTRLAGPDRFATAAAIAEASFDAADAAHLATGVDFPDALAAGPVAGLRDGPLLLTSREDLPAATTGQLRRLTPRHVGLLGGDGVIGAAVESDVSTLVR